MFELCIFEPCRVPDRKRIVNAGFPRVFVCARGFTASYYVRRCPGNGQDASRPGSPVNTEWLAGNSVRGQMDSDLPDLCKLRDSATLLSWTAWSPGNREKASGSLGGATCTRIPHSQIHPRRPLEAHGGRSSASQVDQLHSWLEGVQRQNRLARSHRQEPKRRSHGSSPRQAGGSTRAVTSVR